MAQGSRQIQSQAQQQIQTLSPQQILVVKLLELPAVELEDRVHAELLENPALEEGKEESTSDETTPAETSEGETEGDTDYDSLSDYLTEDDIPDYKLQENNRSKGEQAEEIPEPEFEMTNGTCASVRLDALIGLAFQTSRSSMVSFIESGLVFVNGKLITSNGYEPKEGDIISIRSKGRFIYDGVSRQTKKGRLGVRIRKYV